MTRSAQYGTADSGSGAPLGAGDDAERRLRDRIVALGASLFARGFSVGSAGNISARSGDGVLMTPTNASLGRLDPERLSLLGPDYGRLSGDAPSKEVVLHRAVYEARPDARAVVHLHSPYATALSCLAQESEQAMPALTPYHVMRLGSGVPVIRYGRPGSDELFAEVRDAMRSGPAALLGNHGSLVAGASLEDAVNAAEELEASAQLAFVLHGRAARALTPDEVSELERMRIR